MKKITLLFLLLFEAFTSSFGQASLCEDAVSITLPYADTDFTGLYGNNYGGAPGSSCGGSLSFLYRNDVVYAYTPTADGSINITLATTYDYVGLFIYDDCADIGVVLRMVIDVELATGRIGRDEPVCPRTAVEQGEARDFPGDPAEADCIDQRRSDFGLGLRVEAPDADRLLRHIELARRIVGDAMLDRRRDVQAPDELGVDASENGGP